MFVQQKFYNMKKFNLFLLAILFFYNNFAQNVGIGTYEPDPSAIADINSIEKGLLIPRVCLQSATDKVTILLPAYSLLVYNLCNNLEGGAGFYYNNGTPALPQWIKLTTGNGFTLPYSNTISNIASAFYVGNNSANTNSGAMAAVSTSGYGLRAISTTGVGLFATSTSGDALQVNGKLKIFGSAQIPGAGKVLTSDASGNATWQSLPAAPVTTNVAFAAYGVAGGGSEIMGTGVFSKVPFWAEKYDLGNNYNNYAVSPHSTFTAPFNGIYHFEAEISYGLTNIVYPSIYLNVIWAAGGESTLAYYKSNIPEDDDRTQLTISRDVKLSAGDKVFVLTRHDSQTNKALSFYETQAYFAGRLVIKL